MTQTGFVGVVNKPSLIEYKQYRFLIMDAPTDSNLPTYIEILKKKQTVALVRACEPTYKTQPLIAADIRVIELPFDDGDPPPDHMIDRWLNLVYQEFGPAKMDNNEKKDKIGHITSPTGGATASATSPPPVVGGASSGDIADKDPSPNKKTIGVHCVAGLGRAPVLVAIALIEAGMAPFDAINFIRKKRRGAINARQLKYLESYKPRKKLKADAGCVIC